MPTTRTLAAAVFVSDPKTHETMLLQPGAEITDSAIAAQITHPDAWVSEIPRRTRANKADAS